MAGSYQTTFVEQIIEVASRLKDHLFRLSAAYGQMPQIIAEEHQAILTREFNLITAACEKKSELGNQIEALFTGVTRAGDQLVRLLAAHDPEQPPPTTLSQYSEVITRLAQQLEGEPFANQVLRHLADGFAEQVATFLAVYRQVKPQIEGNRHLVTHMMRNYQESYRFWQEVSEQLAISYNSQGVQQAAGRNSGFKARA